MIPNEALVKKAVLLDGLSIENIREYLQKRLFKIVSYNKDTVIHFDGDQCTKLEIILSGEVVVERLDESGGLLTVAEFLKNDILGGTLLFSKKPEFPMTVTTRQLSLILEIDGGLLFDLFQQYPLFLKKYLEYVADHTTLLGYKLKNLANKTIRESVLSYLKHESKIQKSNKIKLNMTKKLLAEKIGIQRTSLSRELAKMKKDGLITFDAKYITILHYRVNKCDSNI